MKKLLFLTDFSPASEKAIYFAQTLFDHTAAEFKIIHTYPVNADLIYGTSLELDAAEANAQQQLTELLTKITIQPVPEYHTYLIQTHIGEPVMTAEYMLEQDVVDFIVVGASGSHSGELFGSTATGMIRNCQTNVIVVPAFTPIRPLNEVVLAADIHSINNLKTLQPLKDILDAKETKLTLLTVVDQKSPITPEDIQERQKRVADFLTSTPVESYIIHDDKIEHGIIDYLDTHDVDLLVTIPHQKSFFDVLKGSSVTRKLAFKPQVPLLTLFEKKPHSKSIPVGEEISVGGLMLY